MAIVTWNNDPTGILGKVATPVEHGEKCRDLIEAMFVQMDYPNGIGLAAPQIGEDKRIIVIKVPALRNGKRIGGCTKHAIINPELSWWKGHMRFAMEGCLSFPGEQVMIPRFVRVKVTGFDIRWNPLTVGGKDLVARVLQHEIDHLNGKTLDYYANMAEQMAAEQAEE